MANAETALRAEAPRGLPTRVLIGVAAVLVAMRIALNAGIAPIGDEAYYWLWGQRPALSYFDHPPLNAWLLGLSSRIFGWNLFALRFPTWLTSALTLYLFHLWARRLAPADWQRWFWVATVIFLASPLYMSFSAIVFPDHLLVALSLWAIYAFAVFLDSWDRGVPRWSALYWSALALGFAALTKYNAVVVAVAMISVILLSRRRWRLLASWQLYAAAAITIALLSPVLVWNLQHDFASFRFHLGTRYGGAEFALEAGRAKAFWLIYFVYLSPLLVLPIVAFLIRRPQQGFARASHDLGRLVFVVSTGLFTLMAMTTPVAPYWNITAFAPLVPHLVAYAGARVQLTAHVLFGMLAVVLIGFNMGVAPLATLNGGGDWESSVVHGWEQIADEVARAEQAHAPDFVAATRYTLAAQLAFQRGRDDVTALQVRVDQFDYWFDPAAHQGQTALILGDMTQRIDGETRARFRSIEQVGEFEVTRFGRVVNTYQLFLGRGFGEPPAQP